MDTSASVWKIDVLENKNGQETLYFKYFIRAETEELAIASALKDTETRYHDSGKLRAVGHGLAPDDKLKSMQPDDDVFLIGYPAAKPAP